MKLKTEFLSCTSHISSSQQTHVVNGYCIEWHRYRTFLSLWKVLLDNTIINKLLIMQWTSTATWQESFVLFYTYLEILKYFLNSSFLSCRLSGVQLVLTSPFSFFLFICLLKYVELNVLLKYLFKYFMYSSKVRGFHFLKNCEKWYTRLC